MNIFSDLIGTAFWLVAFALYIGLGWIVLCIAAFLLGLFL
jgi:hypothetical protein